MNALISVIIQPKVFKLGIELLEYLNKINHF